MPSPVKRLNPGDDGYDRIFHEWVIAGKPRNFDLPDGRWRQLVDVQGVCFVLTGTNPPGEFYSESSYKGFG